MVFSIINTYTNIKKKKDTYLNKIKHHIGWQRLRTAGLDNILNSEL